MIIKSKYANEINWDQTQITFMEIEMYFNLDHYCLDTVYNYLNPELQGGQFRLTQRIKKLGLCAFVCSFER